MKKYRRILSSQEFDEIIQKRRYKTSGSYTVYIKDKEKEKSRYGIAVSKKLGNAVLRNKTKRQISNMIQETNDKKHIYDYIIIVKRGYFTKTYEENRNDLEKLLKTVKM